MKKIFLYYIVAVFVLAACGSSNSEEEYAIEGQTAEGFEDGSYCADVNYYNPNTKKSSKYRLEIEVKNNQIMKINFGNDTWLDNHYFNPENLDEHGGAVVESNQKNQYIVKIKGKNCTDLDIVSIDELEDMSQSFNLEELLTLVDGDQNYFDSYVQEKGYQFQKTDLSEDRIDYVYLSKNSSEFSSDVSIISFADYISDDHWAATSCTYRTNKNSEYTAFKTQLIEKGFLYEGSRGVNQSLFLLYRNEKMNVILSTENYNDAVIYQIELILRRNNE